MPSEHHVQTKKRVAKLYLERWEAAPTESFLAHSAESGNPPASLSTPYAIGLLRRRLRCGNGPALSRLRLTRSAARSTRTPNSGSPTRSSRPLQSFSPQQSKAHNKTRQGGPRETRAPTEPSAVPERRHGLYLRQGTDLKFTPEPLDAVADQLNAHPRQTHNWRIPTEVQVMAASAAQAG